MTKKRPPVLNGKTIKTKTECGALYVTLNKDDNGELYETRFVLGKAGTCQNAMFNTLGVLFSILIQQGIPKDKLIRTLKKHMKGINCGTPFMRDDKKYQSCLDLIGVLISEELEQSEPEKRES
jgi:ribonucleoside-diphosphate reductase alpha chain